MPSSNNDPRIPEDQEMLPFPSGIGTSSTTSSLLGIRTRHRSGTVPSIPVSSVGSVGSVSSVSSVDGFMGMTPNIWGKQTPMEPLDALEPSSGGRTTRSRSYSANNVLLNAGDRQFLTNCSTIREEAPPIMANQMHVQTNAFSRPRSQTMGFPPLFGGYTPNLNMAAPMNTINTHAHNNSVPATTTTITNPVSAAPPVRPLLSDGVPESSISLTSTHTNPSLGPTDTLLVINVPRDPALTNAANFYRMMAQFGPMTSVRVISCTDSTDLVVVVQFQDVESAVRCKNKMNYQELAPGLSCLVTFAKIICVNEKQDLVKPLAQVSPISQVNQAPQVPQINTTVPSGSSSGPSGPQIPSVPSITQVKAKTTVQPTSNSTINQDYDRFKQVLADLEPKTNLNPESLRHLFILIKKSLKYNTTRDFGLGRLPDPLAVRLFETPRLREIRKQLDGGQLDTVQVEQLALAMYDELPELASDYLGNTIVQKLLETCGKTVRDVIVKQLCPYLAQMGAHKNGTWAAQKMINTTASNREKWMISTSLYKFCTQLFNDQYANYVVHGVLKFGAPYNDFIIETMMATFMEIARNRFGARAIRTCMESDCIAAEGVVAISVCIVTWCWDLMQDPNGSLLITWFLDTCTAVKDRHLLLAERICQDLQTTSGVAQELGINLDVGSDSEKLAQLCCSKLGHLSLLKLLNCRTDMKPRDLLLGRIFGVADTISPVLVSVLADGNGANFIFKVITIPTLDPELHSTLTAKVRTVIQENGLSSSHQHKRLCEEVGLKPLSRPRTLSGVSRRRRSRSGSINSLNGSSHRFTPPLNPQQFGFDGPQQNLSQPQNPAPTDLLSLQFDSMSLNRRQSQPGNNGSSSSTTTNNNSQAQPGNLQQLFY